MKQDPEACYDVARTYFLGRTYSRKSKLVLSHHTREGYGASTNDKFNVSQTPRPILVAKGELHQQVNSVQEFFHVVSSRVLQVEESAEPALSCVLHLNIGNSQSIQLFGQFSQKLGIDNEIQRSFSAPPVYTLYTLRLGYLNLVLSRGEVEWSTTLLDNDRAIPAEEPLQREQLVQLVEKKSELALAGSAWWWERSH